MTDDNRKIEIIKEILYIAINNPGGYLEEDEIDLDDQSPEDVTVMNSGMIVAKCRQLLKLIE